MALTDITFSLNAENLYESEAMKGVNGNLDVHLEFETPSKVSLRRSITGDNFTGDNTLAPGAVVYDATIGDMSEDLYVKLYCTKEPKLAKKSA